MIVRIFSIVVLVVGALAGTDGMAFAQPAQPTQPAQAAHVRRVAVVVGANDPAPGRSPLRFAHDDAKRMADVLQRVGHFAAADVHVLLEPNPAELARALDDVAAAIQASGPRETLFLFYYSGHSDGQAVYPHGAAMSLADLRDRITRVGARVRVGVLDTCRGGSWTQAKGLTVGPPLEPVDIMTLTAEGTALVSSSSGFENAHEAQAIGGSFFTHHLAAGLLGAADRSGDGSITLQEAFDYAKERTVRDSARMAQTTQHPSYDVQLRGRQDIVLAQIAESPSALEVRQAQGPIEVIHLSSGITIIELPQGARTLRLALAPGRYVVRRTSGDKTYSKVIDIAAGATVVLEEGQLTLTATERLAMKGDEKLPVSLGTTIPRGTGELRLGVGVSTGATYRWGPAVLDARSAPTSRELERSLATGLSLSAGITDRLQWAVPVPAFAYRFGAPGKFEIVPRLGLTAIGYSSAEGLVGTVDGGVALRAWTRPNQSVIGTFSGSSRFASGRDNSSTGTPVSGYGPTTWGMQTTLGYSWTINNAVTINFATGLAGAFAFDGPLRPSTPTSLTHHGAALLFGSVQSIGYRSIPLVQVHLNPYLSLDAHASWAVDLETGDVRDRYLAGFTWNF